MNTECKSGLVKDSAIVLRSLEDVKQIINLIESAYFQADLRGEEVLVEVWVPKVEPSPKRSMQ